MSSITDSSLADRSPAAGQTVLPFGRRAGDAAQLRAGAQFRAAEPETVTLNKVGDFLELDFRRLGAWLKSGVALAAVLAVVGAGAGGAYSVLATPKYTVKTDILIDPTNLQVVADDLYSAPGAVDSSILNSGSKQRVLTSGNVLARVVEDLNLSTDPEFVGDGETGLSFSSLFGGIAKAERDPRLAAQAALAKSVSTTADEKSFVTTLAVSAESPDKAITISSSMVKAFQEELAGAEAEGASRTAAALNDRLDELKTAVKTAEEKVEAYKRANNLVATSGGELVSTQTMAQLNQQVIDADARVIAAQAAYNELVAAGSGAVTADTQASTTLSTLRASAGTLRQQLEAQQTTYGPLHPSVARLQSELSAANAQLDAEIGRVQSAAKAELDQATAARSALSARADALKASVFTDNDAMVTLRELERDAASKVTIYEAFLSRARQVTEREQIDTTNVRVISTAVPPTARAWPPRPVLMILGGAAAGLALGLAFAVGFGILRDLRGPRREKRAKAAAA